MRLIDILNKIANGELKEGTKVIWGATEFIYKNFILESETGNSLYDYIGKEIGLLAEVELIEPTDNTKIEEVSAWGRTTFEYGSPVPADWVMANKINEIIRYINK
jgi:hypothetical protein